MKKTWKGFLTQSGTNNPEGICIESDFDFNITFVRNDIASYSAVFPTGYLGNKKVFLPAQLFYYSPTILLVYESNDDNKINFKVGDIADMNNATDGLLNDTQFYFEVHDVVKIF